MPMTGQLSVSAMRTVHPVRTGEDSLHHVLGVLRNPDLVAIAAFVAIGLLATACFTLLFPLSDQIASFAAMAS